MQWESEKMLEIHQTNDISKYDHILENLSTDKQYEAVESYGKDGEVTGFAVYAYENDSVCIYHCEYGEDTALCDGILRTVLFKACLKGIDKGICRATINGTNLFEKFRYGTSEAPYEVKSISDFLDGCKKCKENS